MLCRERVYSTPRPTLLPLCQGRAWPANELTRFEQARFRRKVALLCSFVALAVQNPPPPTFRVCRGAALQIAVDPAGNALQKILACAKQPRGQKLLFLFRRRRGHRSSSLRGIVPERWSQLHETTTKAALVAKSL